MNYFDQNGKGSEPSEMDFYISFIFSDEKCPLLSPFGDPPLYPYMRFNMKEVDPFELARNGSGKEKKNENEGGVGVG